MSLETALQKCDTNAAAFDCNDFQHKLIALAAGYKQKYLELAQREVYFRQCVADKLKNCVKPVPGTCSDSDKLQLVAAYNDMVDTLELLDQILKQPC